MNLESCKNVIHVNAEDKIEFKLCPLFNDQKLDIKNCMLEIEYFFNAMPPFNIQLQKMIVLISEADKQALKENLPNK